MISSKIEFYQSNKYKDGTSPVVLRITHNRRSFRISLYRCKPENWDSQRNQFKRNFNNFKAKNAALRAQLDKVDTIMDAIRKSGKPFSKELFKQHYRGFDKDKTVYAFVQELVEAFDKKGKTSNKSI